MSQLKSPIETQKVGYQCPPIQNKQAWSKRCLLTKIKEKGFFDLTLSPPKGLWRC
jgi:hypothetical protein